MAPRSDAVARDRSVLCRRSGRNLSTHWRSETGERQTAPFFIDPLGISNAAGSEQSASGHAGAKAWCTRLAVSTNAGGDLQEAQAQRRKDIARLRDRIADGSLDARNGALSVPGFGLVPRLRIAAHGIFVADGGLGSHGVGGFVDLSRQRPCSGQAEDAIEAIALAPAHRLGARIMPLATKQNARFRAAFAGMSHELAQTGVGPRRPTASCRAQDHRDRTALLRVVDVDLRVVDVNRQKAALVVMRVEQRQLLIAMRHVAGVVDVERDGRRRLCVGRHPMVDERIGQAEHVAKTRRVSAHRVLATSPRRRR